MTLDELTKIMAYACTAYDRELTEDMAVVYFEQLQGYQWLKVGAAVKHHVRTSAKFPTVADIRAAIGTLERRHGDPEVRRNRIIARRLDERRKPGMTAEQVSELVTEIEQSLSIRMKD